MSDLLNPNYLNYPQQTAKNTKDIDNLKKVYKTSQNLTSSATKILISTTNILKPCNDLIDRFLFSRNGLLFKIVAFDVLYVFIDFYSDLSSTNEVITNFEFEPEGVVYGDGVANLVGKIIYNQDSLLDPVEAPAEVKIPLIAGEGIIIDANEDNDKILAKIDSEVISNPNLLINGDFRVNQRGQNSYTRTGNHYTVDRWRANSGSVVTILSKGIQLSPRCEISQFFESDFYEALNGYTVTFTINTSVGILTKTFVWNSSQGWTNLLESNNWRLAYAGNGYIRITNLSNENNATIYWVKLEVGSFATPFSPRPYAEELAMCQRYYQRLVGYRYTNVGARTASQVRGLLQYLCEMRTNPTITQLTTLSLYDLTSSTSYSQSSTSVQTTTTTTRTDSAMVALENFSNLQLGNILLSNISDKVFELDAEIY